MEQLSLLQKNIIDKSVDKSVVIADAAAGKTRVLTEKVRQLLLQNVDPTKIVVITFTNMAAEELRQRLGDDYQDGLYVGTIHGLANTLLVRGGISTKEVLDTENFDKLFKMISEHEFCIPEIDWVLLDEGQDSDKLQFEFLFEKIKPKHYFICMDPKQSIYQWKGSDPTLIKKLIKKEKIDIFELNENYRNGRNILGYAKRIIERTGLEDNSIAMRETPGEVFEYYFTPQVISDFIENFDDEYKDWAVLVRTNRDLELVQHLLDKRGIPNDTFKQGDLTRDTLYEKLKENTVKVLTVHSAKGLEWKNVIALGMRKFSNEERNVCYVAVTRARDRLLWLKPEYKRKLKRF